MEAPAQRSSGGGWGVGHGGLGGMERVCLNLPETQRFRLRVSRLEGGS